MTEQELIEIESHLHSAIEPCSMADVAALVAEIRRQRAAMRAVLVAFTNPETTMDDLSDVLNAMSEGIA